MISIVPDLSDELWCYIVRLEGRTVGRAYCVIGDERSATINDLFVEESVVNPARSACGRFLRLFIPPKPRNLRGQGVGRSLMNAVLATARERGIVRVLGSVTREDLDRTPHLLPWYRRLGFVVGDPDGECLPDATYKIELVL